MKEYVEIGSQNMKKYVKNVKEYVKTRRNKPKIWRNMSKICKNMWKIWRNMTKIWRNMKKYVNILDLALLYLYWCWDLEKFFLRLQPVSEAPSVVRCEVSLSGICGKIWRNIWEIFGKYVGSMREIWRNMWEIWRNMTWNMIFFV